MITRDRVIRFEVYQLLCALKVTLLRAGLGRLRADVHEEVFHLLVMMKKYCRAFHLQDILGVVADMQENWLSVYPGEERPDIIDSLMSTANKLSEQISPFKFRTSSERPLFR